MSSSAEYRKKKQEEKQKQQSASAARLVNPSTGFDSEIKKASARLVNPHTGFDSEEPSSFRFTRSDEAALKARHAVRKVYEMNQMRASERQALLDAAQRLQSKGNSAIRSYAQSLRSERQAASVKQAEALQQNYGWKNINGNVVWATPNSPLPDPRTAVTASRAQAPGAYGIKPSEYVAAMGDIDHYGEWQKRGPESRARVGSLDESSSRFVEKWFPEKTEEIPTMDEVMERFGQLDPIQQELFWNEWSQNSVLNEAVQHDAAQMRADYDAEGTRLRQAYDDAIRMLGEDAVRYAGNDSENYYARYRDTFGYQKAETEEPSKVQLPVNMEVGDRFLAASPLNAQRAYELQRQGLLTNAERQEYEYIRQKYGDNEAQAYLDSLRGDLNKRLAVEKTKQAETFANEHPIAAGNAAFLDGLAGGGGYAQVLLEKLLGKETDTYDPRLNNSRMVNAAGKAVADQIRQNWGSLGDTAAIGYQAATGAMQSLGRYFLYGASGALTQGSMSSAESTFNNMMSRGANAEQAHIMAGAAGVFEALFERYSIENLVGLMEGNGIGPVIANVLRSAGIEASEEGATTAANLLAEQLTLGDLSAYEQARVRYINDRMGEDEARSAAIKDMLVDEIGPDMLLGGLSGGMIGAAGYVGGMNHQRGVADTDGSRVNWNEGQTYGYTHAEAERLLAPETMQAPLAEPKTPAVPVSPSSLTQNMEAVVPSKPVETIEAELKRSAKTLKGKTATAYLNNYEDNTGLTVGEYYTSFMSVYGASRKGMSYEEAKEQANMPLSETASLAAWNAGQREAIPVVQSRETQALSTENNTMEPAEVEQEATAVVKDEASSTPSGSLANNLLTRFIGKGTSFNSAVLFEAADKAFGGTQAAGTYSPKDAYDAMELAVNKHLMGLAKDMNGDAKTARRALNRLDNLLAKLPTQTRRTQEQQDFQQFSTPPNIAYLAAWLGNVNSNDMVLEPSAGVGGIATFAKAWGADVAVNELSTRRLALLNEMGFKHVFNENAEQLNNVLPENVHPSVVLMNPPFSATAGRMSKNSTQNATRHIEQALLRLEDGGRLVAVLGKGMADDAPAFQNWFKKIRQNYSIRANIQVDGTNYRKYGTTWDVQLMVIDKTGPQKGETVTGVYKDLRDIPAALEEIRNDRQAIEKSNAGSAGRAVGQPVPVARGRELGRRSVERIAGKPAGRVGESPAYNDGRRAVSTDGIGSEASGIAKRGDGQGVRDGDGGVPGHVRGESEQLDLLDDQPVPQQPKQRLERQKKPKSDDGVYAEYIPAPLPVKGAKKHPAPLVESAAMAAVQAPNATYQPNLPQKLLESGAISAAQLENIVYAGQAHSQMLPGGTRKGYFIGDGTGVGKGRQISGIILDNFRQGRKKAVWVSKNLDLLPDAVRDWSDIGGDKEAVKSQSAYKLGASIDMQNGILFTGYDTLRSAKGTETRLKQIVDWLGSDFDGVIAFDEVHNLGNLLGKVGARGKTGGSAKAAAGVELQKLLPNARVVYVSATGATDVNELAYAERLGLWGKGTAFKDVNDFVDKIGSSGLSAMELVARDMKAMGVYLARSISYDGVRYDTLQHDLKPMQREIYDTMSEAWQVTLKNINQALEITGGKLNPNARGAARSAYYGAMQRFYNQILTSMSMPSVIADIRKELEAGHSAVLQIVNTNEAETDRQLADAKKNGRDLEELDLTPRGTLLGYLQNSFPVQAFEEYEDDYGKTRSRPVVDSEGRAVIDREAVRMRDALIERVNQMSVPDGPLEMLFDAFGTENVAEVTGRSRRVVPRRNERGETVRTEETRSSRHAMSDVEAFQNGDKRILVFSDAGGTGKSYHADLRAKNQQQRVHYLVQPGWSASKATQGFGRTHRSNQAQPPLFKLVTTDVMGQKRFVSTIARRLDQLGALTKGQRETGSGMFGAKDNLESALARDSLRAFYENLGHGRLDGLDAKTILDKLGLYEKFTDEYGRFRMNDEASRDMNLFLNRILALGVDEQNRVFSAFYDLFEAAYDRALENGTLDMGMETVRADKIEIVDDTVVRTDPATGADTRYVQAKTYRKPVLMHTVEQLTGMRQHFVGLFETNEGEVRGVFQIADKTGSDGKIHKMYRMQSPAYSKYGTWSEATLAERAKALPRKEWKAAWAREVAAQPEYMESTTHMLTGALLPVWNLLPQEGNTKAMRIIADDGRQYLGRVIDPSKIDGVLARFGAAARTKESYKPADLMQRIMAGESAHLMQDHLTLKRSRVSGEYRVEVTGQNLWYLPKQYADIITEKINYQYRYFIPTGEKGVKLIGELTANNPVAEVTTGHDVEYRRTVPSAVEQHTPEQLKIMREYEEAVDERLLRLAKKSKLGTMNDKEYVKIIHVPERMAEDVLALVGIDVRDYDICIDNNGFQHIEARHGSDGEQDHSMADLKDVARIGYVLENYQVIERLVDKNGEEVFSKKYKDKNNRPSQVLKLEKRIDGTYVTSEAIPDGKRKKIWIQTAYIKKAKEEAKVPDGNAPKLTPKAPLSDSSIISIAQNGSNMQARQNRTAEAANPGDWTAQRVGGTDRRRTGIADIIAKIRHDFDIPVTTGHVRGTGVTGQYDGRSKSIRSRLMHDLPTTSHELGHHLNREYGIVAGMSKEARDELVNALTFGERDRYKDNRTQMESEGFAEFIRKYLQNRETASIDFPLTAEALHSALDADGLHKLNVLADDVNAYYSLTADDAQSEVKLREDKPSDYLTLKEKLKGIADRIYLAWVDANHGLKRFDRATGADSYKLASNSAYADAVAGQILTGELTDMDGQPVGHGLQQALKGINLSRRNNSEEYRAFNEYLVVKHGPERLKEGMRVFANDAKNSTVWMQRRQAELEAMYPQFKEASERLYEFQSQFLQAWGVQSGLVNENAAKKWAERWQYYVPFNRVMEDDRRYGMGAKRGYANQNNTIKRAHGSGRDIMGPVENIITNVVKMVNAAKRNQVMQAVVQAAEMVPNTARFLEAVPDPVQRQTMDMRGLKAALKQNVGESGMDAVSGEIAGDIIDGLDDILVQYVRGKAQGDVVAVLINGKPAFYKVNDPLLLESLTGMAQKNSGALLEAFGRISRFVTGNITGRNIVWSVMSNAPRDLMTLFTYSKDKNPIHLAGGIASAYAGRIKGNNADPLYKEYMAMGGGKTSAYTADKNLQKEIRRKLAGDKTHWMNPLEWIDYASDLIESGPRYATYKLMRQRGMTPQEAFYESADITVNFRRGGRYARQVNKIIPFFNAGIQGVDKFPRWLGAEDIKDPKARKKAIAARVGGFALASLLLGLLQHALTGRDEKEKQDYQNLSSYTKLNYWLFPQGNGKYFAIPKPRELAVLSSLFQTMLDRYGNENLYAFEGFYEYLTNAFLPGGLSELAQGNPSGAVGSIAVLGTISELAANKDYLGRPIVSKSMESLEAKDQYNRQTSKLARLIGEALGISPQQVDYIGNNVLGGFWQWQRALFPVGEENTDLSLGVYSKYNKDSLYSTDHANRLYDYRDAAEKAKNSNPDDMAAQGRYKWLNGMTTFYGRYTTLAKGTEESDETRATRFTVLEMLDGMNRWHDGHIDSPEMDAIDALAVKTGSTGVYPDTMQAKVRDGKGKDHPLTAEQYVDYQTDYLSRYYTYAKDALADPATASAAGMEAVKKQAKLEATARMLSDLRAPSDGKTPKLNGISVQDNIRFQTEMDAAREDGGLKKDEVLDILDGMRISDSQRKQLYGTYNDSIPGNPYMTADELNNWILGLDEDDGAKSSLTSTYKPLLVDRFIAGDDEAVDEIMEKLETLELYDKKGGRYYTAEKMFGWIDAALEKLK